MKVGLGYVYVYVTKGRKIMRLISKERTDLKKGMMNPDELAAVEDVS